VSSVPHPALSLLRPSFLEGAAGLVDTHAHLDDRQFNDDREDAIQRSFAAGVRCIITIGTDLDSSRAAVALARQHASVYAAVGVHPHDATRVGPGTLERLLQYAQDDRVVAVGETGLDFYRNLSPHDRQKEVFIAHLELARRVDKPVIIHDRDAHAETMAILREKGWNWPGVLHCFSGDREMALEAIEMGFYISFAGPVTFPNAHRLQELARELPLERILVETDSPYLAPQPRRGQRNEPANVRWVAAKIAALREISLEQVAEITTENARQLFGLNCNVGQFDKLPHRPVGEDQPVG
jgi:TatD DNase family protein